MREGEGVVEKRTAGGAEPTWLEVFERGKLPRDDRLFADGRDLPAVDVSSLVDAQRLERLSWRVRVLWMALQKPSTSSSTNGQSLSEAQAGQILSPFSELWDFLSRPKYSDGSPRETGTISLRWWSGQLQVTLTDPTSCSYCCQASPTLDDAFLALEIGLKEGNLPWRKSSYGKVRK